MEATETKTKGKQGRKPNMNSARQIRLAKQAAMRKAGIEAKRGRPKGSTKKTIEPEA